MIVLVTLAGVTLSFLLSKPMSAWQLGESYAQNLGVNLRRLSKEREYEIQNKKVKMKK